MSDKDKRANGRVLHSIMAHIKLGEHPAFAAKTLDLSRGGALLDSPVPASVGDTLELTFKVGTTELTPTVCHVRRVEAAFGGRRHCIAVQFSQPNFQLMELVKRDLKNWEIQSDCERLVSSWSENPMRTFW